MSYIHDSFSMTHIKDRPASLLIIGEKEFYKLSLATGHIPDIIFDFTTFLKLPIPIAVKTCVLLLFPRFHHRLGPALVFHQQQL